VSYGHVRQMFPALHFSYAITEPPHYVLCGGKHRFQNYLVSQIGFVHE